MLRTILVPNHDPKYESSVVSISFGRSELTQQGISHVWACDCVDFRKTRKNCKHIKFVLRNGGVRYNIPRYRQTFMGEASYSSRENIICLPRTGTGDRNACGMLFLYGYTIVDIASIRFMSQSNVIKILESFEIEHVKLEEYHEPENIGTAGTRLRRIIF